MTSSSDNLNCLKNLMQVMCCDGSIYEREKVFLKRAATALEVQVDDWGALLKEVLRDKVPLYQVVHRDKAVAALKSLIVMCKADGQIDPKEKEIVLQFAKSIGINKSQWKQILKDIDVEHLFEPFTQTPGNMIAICNDFDKLDAFLKVAAANGVKTRTADLQVFLKSPDTSGAVVCFHAAEDKDGTVTRCQMLLEACGDRLVCILTRFQGNQVKYLLEIGLKKCIIEPVYARDITDLFRHHK